MNVLDAHAVRRVAWARLVAVAALTGGVAVLPADLLPARHVHVLALALLVAALSSGALLTFGPSARPQRLAWLVSLLDVALITAVVEATGGPRSIFVFLYVLLVMAACLMLSRAGALAVAGAASLTYAALVLGRTVLPVTLFLEAPADTTALEVLTIFLNTAVLLVVALVSGRLAAQFGETRSELERERRDRREIQAFNEVLFHSVGAGLIALDRHRTITAVNRAVEELTGFSAPEVIGRPGSTLLTEAAPLDATVATMPEKPTLAPRQETTLRRVDGSVVPVRVTLSALHSAADARLLGMLVVCEDVSELREMEARMREADRLASLGRMAANIAHEIRNPLASLSGAVEAFARDLVAPEERHRIADMVLLESDRLNSIITGFLDYARPAPLALTAVDVVQTIDDVFVLLDQRALPAGVKIVRDSPSTLVWPVDGQQLRQALWNVCLNAVEAMTDGGELRVIASADASELHIDVADTGAGIDSAHLPHVFEPFFSTKPGGSGLGLAMVHRIVRDHGGRVHLDSTPGGGTTVAIRLPRGRA